MTDVLPRRILLFDGECGMCNRLVLFLIDRDHRRRLAFAALQGRFSSTALPRHGIDPSELDTASLVVDAGTDEEKAYTRSSAIVRALMALGGAWGLLGVFLVVPRPVRDFLYRFVAERRHRISKKFSCRLLGPDERDRFLADDDPVAPPR